MARTKRHKADPDTVPVYVGMTPAFVAQLDALASRERRSRSQQAALMLEESLKAQEQTSAGVVA